MRTMTVAIPSSDRRDALRRALLALEREITRDPALAGGLDVLVVLDGSGDGSRTMLARLDGTVPRTVVWQPRAGPAGARQRALDAAQGELVWFLDDDMEVAPGTLARHRASHETAPAPHVLVGACLFPRRARIVAMNREWAEHASLSRTRRVTEPALFSVANTSAPASLLRDAGGFDARLRGWGGEDYDLGARLLAGGAEVRYDPDAVAWHHQRRGIVAMCRTKEDAGRNLVRLARLHPDLVDDLFPPVPPTLAFVRLRRLGRLTAPAYHRLGRALAGAAVAEHAVARGRSRALFHLAVAAHLLAGVAGEDDDGRYLSRLLGTDRGQARRAHA
jgi:glycosyltransferase involved in cell wall biosynthesis